MELLSVSQDQTVPVATRLKQTFNIDEKTAKTAYVAKLFFSSFAGALIAGGIGFLVGGPVGLTLGFFVGLSFGYCTGILVDTAREKT